MSRGPLTDQAEDLLKLRSARQKLQQARQEYEGEVLRVQAGRGDRAIEHAQEAHTQDDGGLDMSSAFPEHPVNMRSPSSGIPAASLAQVAQALGPGAAASGGRAVQQVAGQQLPVAGGVIPEVQASSRVGSQIVRDEFGGFTTVRAPQTQVDVNLRPNVLTARDLVTLERVQRADARAQARLELDTENQHEALIDDYAGGIGSLIYDIQQARTLEQKIQLVEQLNSIQQHLTSKYGSDVAERALGRGRAKTFEIGRSVDKDVAMELLRQSRQEDVQGLLNKMRIAAAKGDKEGEDFYRHKLMKEITMFGYQVNADSTITPIAVGTPKSLSTIARMQARHNTTQMALSIINTLSDAIAEDPDLSGVAGSFLRAGSTATGFIESLDRLTGGTASRYVREMRGLLYERFAAGDLPPDMPMEQLAQDLERLEDPAIAAVEALEILLPYTLVEVLRTDRPNEANIKAYREISKVTGLGGERAPRRLAMLRQLLERNESFTREQLIQSGGKVIEQPTGPLDVGKHEPTSSSVTVVPLPSGGYKLVYPDGREVIQKR